MTLPPDTIEGAEFYGAHGCEVAEYSSVNDAVEAYVEHCEWQQGATMQDDEVTIIGLRKTSQTCDDDGVYPCIEVGRVEVDLVEWCQENWPERLEKP